MIWNLNLRVPILSKSAKRQWQATFCSCFGAAITMSSTIAYNSILVSSLQEDEDMMLSFENVSWLIPCWSMAAMLGCFVGGFVSDILGRKLVIILSTLFYLAGYIIAAFSSSLEVVLLSCFLRGFGDGMLYPNILVYVAEIADKNLRGSLSNLINICFNLGVVFTFAASIFVTWRTLAWILTVPVFLAWIGIYLVPETPYWLAQKNRIDDALKSLSWLRNNSETEEEITELKEKIGGSNNTTFFNKIQLKWKVIQSKSFWKPFILVEPLNILYSCSGTSIMLFYMVTVFEQSGSSIDKLQASLIVSAWSLVMSSFGTIALMKLPRRTLFLYTASLICVSMFCLGLFSYFQSNGFYKNMLVNFGWLPLIFVLLIFAGSQLGYRPIIKIIVSEVFPTEVRSIGTSVTLLTTLVCQGTLSKLFSQFILWFGFYGTIFFYTGVVFLSIVYGYLMMPEHSSASLFQIEEEFGKDLE